MAHPNLWSIAQADSAHIELAFASIKSNGLGILDFSFTTDFRKAKRNLEALISSCGSKDKIGLKLPINRIAKFENRVGLLSELLAQAPGAYLLLSVSPKENLKTEDLSSLIELLNLPANTNTIAGTR